ncbi:hypothetical protein [Paraburkholderia terrae]|uniref:hypothetical protein n=1 Tax=Paraburkholderia terrae TaxID=311230 RepID=UPI00336551D7
MVVDNRQEEGTPGLDPLRLEKIFGHREPQGVRDTEPIGRQIHHLGMGRGDVKREKPDSHACRVGFSCASTLVEMNPRFGFDTISSSTRYRSLTHRAVANILNEIKLGDIVGFTNRPVLIQMVWRTIEERVDIGDTHDRVASQWLKVPDQLGERLPGKPFIR